MLFGGNGVSGAGVVNGVAAQYMFPGDTDPFNWSTYGVAPPSTAIPWTEQEAGNAPNDRRFIQSAGPFTLEPGDYNNITLGVVWARAIGGDPYESVQLLRLADDKAQSLFDNCFELVNGPDAPDVTVQELDREIILMRHYEQLNNQEIAQSLGLTEPAASMRYLRALKRLREVIEGQPTLHKYLQE
jgi:hypothetical protein